MHDIALKNIATENKGLIARSLLLSGVLYFSNSLYRKLYCFFAAYWLVSYGMHLAVPSTQLTMFIMFLPAILQAILAMMVGMRASSLLQNTQLHFVGIRKELFINLLVYCVLLSLPVYDPKNADNLMLAKLISFTYLGAGMLLMVWFYSLQILPLLLLVVSVVAALCLIPTFGVMFALVGWNLIAWGYFAYWLARSPLQRMFKFENFNNFMDYLVERYRLAKYRTVMTRVLRKEHVILMGEGDGHLNRILFSQVFSLIFTSLYIVAMQSMKEMCLWMIMMHLGGTKARVKIGQSHMKLWLLGGDDRQQQFQVTESLSLRLYAYTFATGLMMLAMWIITNPEFAMHGFISLCLVQLFVIAADYYHGFILKIGSPALVVLLLFKMTFMWVLAFIHLDLVWYAVMAAAIISLGAIFRSDAKKKFVSANFTLRAS